MTKGGSTLFLLGVAGMGLAAAMAFDARRESVRMAEVKAANHKHHIDHKRTSKGGKEGTREVDKETKVGEKESVKWAEELDQDEMASHESPQEFIEAPNTGPAPTLLHTSFLNEIQKEDEEKATREEDEEEEEEKGSLGSDLGLHLSDSDSDSASDSASDSGSSSSGSESESESESESGSGPGSESGTDGEGETGTEKETETETETETKDKESVKQDRPRTYRELYLGEKRKEQEKAVQEIIENGEGDYSYKGDGSAWSKRIYFIKEAYRRAREKTPIDPSIKRAVKLGKMSAPPISNES